jgi:tRNA (mo5U34)-methyltransferase
MRSGMSSEWYHTIELAPGSTTPGWFDTRPVARQLPIPDSLDGRRCLDIGTFDGFWAFEMERRGADEVVAIDVLDPDAWDWPAGSAPGTKLALAARKRGGAGFMEAREALGSSVEFRELSVYDLDPVELGEFDFVYLGSLLMHLRDPVGALVQVREVCRGELLVVDNHDPVLSFMYRRSPVARLEGLGRPWWWRANISALVRMLEAAGFELERSPQRIAMPAGAGQPRPPLRPSTLRHPERRRELYASRRGDPHVALLARPSTTEP